jgi:hypothetical protein
MANIALPAGSRALLGFWSPCRSRRAPIAMLEAPPRTSVPPGELSSDAIPEDKQGVVGNFKVGFGGKL